MAGKLELPAGEASDDVGHTGVPADYLQDARVGGARGEGSSRQGTHHQPGKENLQKIR